MSPLDADEGSAPPIWAAFGDLMACLFGLFVLFFVWLVTVQVALSEDLEQQAASLEEATARLDALESALAGPLASGLITLVDGTIGIRGSVLFDLSSAELRPEGRALLVELAPPLTAYLESQGQSVMISGFTDDLPLRPMADFADNWELSAERALTVTRALVEAGIPSRLLFAAGFGENHPVAPNDSEAHRAQNRRVEIAPVPRPATLRAAAEPTR